MERQISLRLSRSKAHRIRGELLTGFGGSEWLCGSGSAVRPRSLRKAANNRALQSARKCWAGFDGRRRWKQRRSPGTVRQRC